MSCKDRVRLDALLRVERNEVTVVLASELMGVSLRQGRRLWKRYKAQGAAGLVHQGQERPSNRRLAEELRLWIVKRHQAQYADFRPTLACEQLAKKGLGESPDT